MDENLRAIAASAIMPSKILQAAEKAFSLCKNQFGGESKPTTFAEKLVSGITAHQMNRIRFGAMAEKLKSVHAKQVAFNKNAEGSLHHALQFMIRNRADFEICLKEAIAVLDELLQDGTDLTGRLNALKSVVDQPVVNELSEYIHGQQKICAAMKIKLRKTQKKMNTCSDMKAPGAEYGLVLEKDIKLDLDGDLMVWSDDENTWEYADDLHPCRKVPGSNWGKFSYELVNGEFFSEDAHTFIDWAHATPAKMLLESMDSLQMLLQVKAPIQTTPSSRRQIWKKNKQLAVDTGLPYPLLRVNKLERTIYDLDVENIINEPFGRYKPISKIPRPEHISAKVDEVFTGVLDVENIQQQERFVYVFPEQK